MKWEFVVVDEEDEKMEVEEIEAVLEKIWDLHDKLSDAIHSISRAHFQTALKSCKAQPQAQPDFYFPGKNKGGDEDSNDAKKNHRNGYVYVKGYGPVDEDDDSMALHEAKSLNAIRTALENLEDQLEFFHTVQTQQRAERDAALARLEQSRIVLAMRLAEHNGKKYKVIEEARAFVGGVHKASRFISSENPYNPAPCVSDENVASHEGRRSNFLSAILSKLNFVKRSLKLDQMGGVIGNAALIAISMLVLMQMQPAVDKGRYNLDMKQGNEEALFKRNLTKVSQPGSSSSSSSSSQLDVLLARG